MMQITEDTPPDMLAGAMDLTVHLPNGRTMKLSVERSTPMMDLLVQITVANHLQLSNHTLQALAMAPSTGHGDVILPFKPNTPIGALDTQHVRVLPKGKTFPAPKYIAPGHQPFESTFRLKVHLPRNQLYVTRVSRNVLLEDIMKKVCEEKNLDPVKYDFKHPGNLDAVLDPKLTLSDYQITEIYVVGKGATNLNQAFSTADIMSLRKEEERKQMHNKTGGGVFNLIFKRGKSSMGSGSVSSDNRSISPTHSDDSRSVTPPAIQMPAIVTLPRKDPPPDRPKPPQRKRRPAPKPPQIQVSETSKEESIESATSATGTDHSQEPPNKKTSENGLTICHSRNSSDSSGYHEASILSDHCANTSLPRSRPKSALVGGEVPSQSTSNLSKMSVHSRSTTSLITGRRKKAAPPPPPLATSPASSVITQTEKPSPLVASHSDITINTESSEVLDTSLTPTINLTPIPTPRSKPPDVPIRHRPKSQVISTEIKQNHTVHKEAALKDESNENSFDSSEPFIRSRGTRLFPENNTKQEKRTVEPIEFRLGKYEGGVRSRLPVNDYDVEDMLASLEAVNSFNIEKESLLSPNSGETINIISAKTSVRNLQQDMMSNIFLSDEFIKEKKPPAVVAVIPKTPNSEKKYSFSKDSFGKKRCFKIGSSILEHNFDPETSSIHSKRSVDSISSRNSVTSALNAFEDEISDLNEDMFTGSMAKRNKRKTPEVFNQLFGIHTYENAQANQQLQRNVSVDSLRSSCSIPGFNEARMRKWDNIESLDSMSVNSAGVSNRWVVGDASDAESITSSNLTPGQTPFDSLPLESSTPIKIPSEEKTLESTDSGIPQDTQSEIDKTLNDEPRLLTPPPPPILDDVQSEIIERADLNPTKIVDSVDNQKSTTSGVHVLETSNTVVPEFKLKTDAGALPPLPLSQPPSLTILNKIQPVSLDVKHNHVENELGDVDWQYQLPSPPKAFRDASPAIFENHDAVSVSDFKDSVVTSPELFEKLKTLEDNQSDTGTLKSESTSIASEEPLNTLSLEHLEKRKSLVYNRELSTSLKMTDNLESRTKNNNNFTSSCEKLPEHYDEKRATPIHKETVRVKSVAVSHHNTLPNFKIMPYDVPKQNITVFEDDTIRSNTTQVSSALTKTHVGQSTENISINRKSSLGEEKGYSFYKPAPNSFNSFSTVVRSESFSADRPIKPVSRSKSSLTLNKYQTSQYDTKSMSRSNSVLDVSGLQSLEVMKLIQNKLSTPTSSIENISFREKTAPPAKPAIKTETLTKEPPVITQLESRKETQPTSPQPVKKYYYKGPPAVNMATWSERPKVPVVVKEDDDYKLGNAHLSSKLIVKTTNNDLSSNNTIEVKANGIDTNTHERNINNKNITANGTNQITQTAGNVVIKIGGFSNNNSYIKNMEPKQEHPVFRKTFTNMNIPRNESRPHSVAFGSDFDLSRVPVVRSVEFKKPYRDIHNNNNTTITHISGNSSFGSNFTSVKSTDSFVGRFQSTENLRNIEKQESDPVRRVLRVNSFKPVESQATPTVRGFRNSNIETDYKRYSWTPPTNYGTLPPKPKTEKEYSTNQNVPFSQSTLRRTESSKIIQVDQHDLETPIKAFTKPKVEMTSPVYSKVKPMLSTSTPPPPPPQMPKIALKKASPMESKGQSSSLDSRDMLLESIRNFGGKRGLRAVKV